MTLLQEQIYLYEGGEKKKQQPKIQEQLSYGKITSEYLESVRIWVYSLILKMSKSMVSILFKELH